MIIFDLKIENWPSDQYTGLNQYVLDLLLDNGHQYILECSSILGAIVVDAGTLSFEQVMPTFRDLFPVLLNELSEQDNETSLMAAPRVTCGRERVPVGAPRQKLSAPVKKLRPRKDNRLSNSQIRIYQLFPASTRKVLKFSGVLCFLAHHLQGRFFCDYPLFDSIGELPF